MDIIRTLLADLPLIHKGETEMPKGYQVTTLSSFSMDQQQRLAANTGVCWALGEPVLRYIHDHVQQGHYTLEIGSGLSTLVFAHKQTHHICITPSQSEIAKLTDYASQTNIPFEKVSFINELSETAVPRLSLPAQLDLLLIDGKHAFPWPFIDWFYTVVHLKKGGLLIIDDTPLITGKILCDFMKKDPNWEFVTQLDGKTEVFRKLSDDIREVAWHMQPFVTEPLEAAKQARASQNRSFYRKVKNKLKQLLS